MHGLIGRSERRDEIHITHLGSEDVGASLLKPWKGDRLTGRKGNLPFQKPLLSFRDGFPVLVLRDGSSQRKK